MLKLALSLLLATLAVVGAQAQVVTNPASVADAGAYNVSPPTCTDGKFCYLQTDSNGQLKVAASVSASVTGFAPGGAYASLTATGSSADAALPAGAVVVAWNTGTTSVSCKLGIGAQTAVASQNVIPSGGSWFGFTVGSNTHIACINQAGDSASNVVVLSGGAGIPTGSGGGGGAGSSSITTWAGGTLGSMANYGTSPGAVLVPGVNAFVTNLPTGAATSANQSTEITALNSLVTNTSSAIPAGSNTIGKVDVLGNAGAALDAAQSAAPSANSVSIGMNASGATGGQQQRVIGCDSTAYYDASTTAKTKIITGVASRKIYICGYVISTGGTATNVSLGSGTGTNCGTTFNQLTPAFQLAANDRVGANAAFWNGLVAPNAADDLCLNASAANAVQVMVWYSIL